MLRGACIDAAGKSFIKHCARVAVVCGLLDGRRGGEREIGDCATRQTICLQHENHYTSE